MGNHLTKSSFLTKDWMIVSLLLPTFAIMGIAFWITIRSHFG